LLVRQGIVKFKICSKCKSTKLLEDFPVQSSNKDGRHPNCKECRSLYYASRYNPEKRRNLYLSKHNEEKETRREYYRKNTQSYFVRKANRRARTLQATPKWYGEFDEFVLSEAYRLCKLREQATGVKWEVDHIVPLKGENVCGLHWSANWAVITQFENRSKGVKYDNRN